MRILRPMLFWIPLIALLLSESGCLVAAAAAGAGAGAMYVKGKSTDSFDADPRAIADATEKAFVTLDIAVISRDVNDAESTIVGKRGDTRVQVTAKVETAHSSKVYVRAGMWGDDPLQARVLQEIRNNLPALPTTSAASLQ